MQFTSAENVNSIPDEAIADIVSQHLVVDTCSSPNDSPQVESSNTVADDASPAVAEEIPVPYHLPGAAVTHDIYTHANSLISARTVQRSKSTNDVRMRAGKLVHEDDTEAESEFDHLDKPGGFRRFHVQQQQEQRSAGIGTSDSNGSLSAFNELFRPDSVCSSDSKTFTDYSGLFRSESLANTTTVHSWRGPTQKTRHFLEYLAITSVLDRFAGENLSDSDSEESPNDEEVGGEVSEHAPLLTSKRKRHGHGRKDAVDEHGNKLEHKASTTKIIFLLFKAFIGSGILFLPKAFSNGGLAFSIASIWVMGMVSLYCFLLLLDCKKYISGSYGDIGGVLYGNWMRQLVLFSIAISQMGFMCGGTIFIVENVIEAVKSMTHDTVQLSPTSLFMLIALLMMPLVLIRKIAKLSPTAALSDVLIIAGLIILLGYDLMKIFWEAPEGEVPPTVGPNIHWVFNPSSFPVFIGTAVYSFEGIGLIIPIRDSMAKPEKFPKVLTLVMAMVALSLCLVGSLGYIAFGSNVETVALLNLPPGPLPSTVQLGYAIAVHLSNALALFPTVRIVEQACFGDRTGKHNMRIKWEKNALRCFIVVVCAVIAWAGASDLDKFISLIGSICCCPLSLIFPPLFHLKLGKASTLSKWGDVVLITFGTGVMLFTLYNTSRQWGSSV